MASVQSRLTDGDVLELHEKVAERVWQSRSKGVIDDVDALDVIDSFATSALRTIALTAEMCGAKIIIVGTCPDVALAMVQFHLNLKALRTALDLEEAFAVLSHGSREAPIDGR